MNLSAKDKGLDDEGSRPALWLACGSEDPLHATDLKTFGKQGLVNVHKFR